MWPSPAFNTPLCAIRRCVFWNRWAPRKKRKDRRRDARYVMHGGSSDRSGLRDAEAHYLLALAADPELHEARLHLGRVRQVQGEITRARESLDNVRRFRALRVGIDYPGDDRVDVNSIEMGKPIRQR